MDSSDRVIDQVTRATNLFPGKEFILEDLDMDTNVTTTYRLKNGEVLEKKFNIG
jgi:hypothetical protein